MKGRVTKSRWADKKHNKEYQSAEYRKNRAIVFLRDAGCCVWCWHLYQKITVENIACDHLRCLAWNEPDHSVSNLMLLCGRCHNLKTTQEAHGKSNPAKPFGEHDRCSEGWQLKINWQAVIDDRNRHHGPITSQPIEFK